MQTWAEHVWWRADYENLFAVAPDGTLCGESSVFYLYDLAAQRRIHRLVPDAGLIAVLRDPVERTHSNWSHLRGVGLEPEGNFLAALELEQQRIDSGWAHFWHYASAGMYGAQLDHLYGLFPPDQVLLLRYRDLVDHATRTADEVCRFLGVDTGTITEVPRRNVRPDVSGREAKPDRDERLSLHARFADDIRRLEAWTGWDLTQWRADEPAGR